jgi:outer membrane receptor protein involved in Fe transport
LKPISRAFATALGATVGFTAAPVVMAADGPVIEEIIVTARKRSESLQDVPISVMAFSSEDIKKKGIKSLEDYARLIPSLTYSSWLPGSSIVVFRGVTVTADAFSGSSSAATYFNEMPISSQGANPEVAVVDMQRLEAVSGPQPTTYGASAQSGVLKFVTAKPDLSELSGYIDVSGSAMSEGDGSYDFQAMGNFPLLEDKFAIRVAVSQSSVGGFVDNISGSSADTHDWTPAFETGYAADNSYPDGFGGDATGNFGRGPIAHVTKSNADVAEDDVGEITTSVFRISGTWQLNDDWRVTGMYQAQKTDVDGISSWNPSAGDLNQIRFKKETKDDDWYIGTLVIEGDLGFADFTSSTGFMNRDIIYDLDSSTYLHQFQGIGGVYYNMLDIANVVYYGAVYSTYTYSIPAYNGSITGFTPATYAYTYYITELTDNTSTMFDDYTSDRFSQEIRLTSKDNGQRYQWMVGGFYEKFETDSYFRGLVDDYGESIAGTLINRKGYDNKVPGALVRNPGQSWYGKSDRVDKQWAVFAEFGVNVTDNLNVLVGLRYFDSEASNQNVTLNADGTQAQTCAEDAAGVCILDTSLITTFNKLGIGAPANTSEDSDTLPLATITYRVNDEILTYYTYSEGFRTGGTNIVRAVSDADDRYDSDKLINNEIGLKTTLFNGRLVLNMAVYQMTWEDIQLVAADPTIDFGWGQVTVNAGEAEINGFETNFMFAATERLRFAGSFSWTDAEITDGASIGDDVVVSKGEKLPLSPEYKTSLSVEYGFPLSMFNAQGYVRADYSYVDEQTNATQGSTLLTSSTLLRGTITTMPDYSITNLMFGIEGESWSVSLALNNVADERAITYVPTRWTDGRVYSVRPRELTLNYTKYF